MLKETLDFISTSFLLEWMNNLLFDHYYFEYEDFSTSLFAFHSFWAKFISRAYNKIKKEKKNSSYVEFQQINGSKGRGRSRCQGYEWYVVATRGNKAWRAASGTTMRNPFGRWRASRPGGKAATPSPPPLTLRLLKPFVSLIAFNLLAPCDKLSIVPFSAINSFRFGRGGRVQILPNELLKIKIKINVLSVRLSD